MSIDGVEIHQDPDLTPQSPGGDALPVLAEDGNSAAQADKLPANFPVNASVQDDGSVILKLRYPVTLKFRDGSGAIKEDRYTELHMQRFNGKRMREVQSATQEQYGAQMIASATGMSLARADILHDAMDATDISAALRVGLFFIAPGRRTGP